MSDAVAIIVGATISAVVAMLVVMAQHRMERAESRRVQRAQRLAEFSSISHAIALGVSEIACVPEVEKAELLDEIYERLRDPFNSVLNAVRLLDPAPIVRAANAIDGEHVRLTELAESREWSLAAWRVERSALSSLVREFVVLAREDLGASPVPAEEFGLEVVDI